MIQRREIYVINETVIHLRQKSSYLKSLFKLFKAENSNNEIVHGDIQINISPHE